MKSYLYLAALLTCLFISTLPNVYAQAPAWSWAKGAVGTGQDGENGIATDVTGNVYITGWYASPTIDFGNGPLTNAGIVNFFVVKYDVSGNILWTRTGGGSNEDEGWAITTDPTGNVLVCGSFKSDSIDFGTGTLLNDSAGIRDIFLSKYDSTGTILWAKRIGSKKEDSPTCIATDSAGNFYVGGYFRSDSLSFDTITVHLISPATSFLAKFDSGGNALWVRTAGGYSAAIAVGVDGSGNVTFAGNFVYLNMTIDTVTLANTDGFGNTDDIYMARYSPAGNLLWAKNYGGDDQDYLTGLSIDIAGNCYVTGYHFSYTILFDTLSLPNVTSGGADFYFTRYDANGNALWATKTPEGYVQGDAVKADSFGNVYVAGSFSDSTATFGNTVLFFDTSAGVYNTLFLAKYTAAGNAVWAKSINALNYTYIYGLTTDAGGNVFMAGEFTGPTLYFDSLSLTNTTSNGATDIYISKIGIPCHAYYTIQPDTAPHTWFAIDYATGAAPLTYSWNWGDGNTSPGATPAHTYAVAGNYNICQTITDANNCTDTYCDSSVYLNRPSGSSNPVTIYVISSVPTGLIDPGSNDNTLAVYPNPSNSRVTISGGGINSTYELTDITGKLLKSGTFTEVFNELDLSNFVKGIYILTVTGKNERVSKKIVRD